jgi:hypothetical protein
VDEQQSYSIGLPNSLLTPHHRNRIREAIWVLCWLWDHITEEYQTDGGERRGRVHGGAVVGAEQIAEQLGYSAQTVRNHLRDLYMGDYIWYRSAGRGFQIDVRNSCKWQKRSFFRSDSSPPSQSGQVRVEESKSLRVERPFNSSTLQDCNSSTLPLFKSPPASSSDNAISNDSTECNPPDEQEEGASKLTSAEVWISAVEVVERQMPRPTVQAVRLCQVHVMPEPELNQGWLYVKLPADPKARERVLNWKRQLQDAIRTVAGGSVSLHLLDPQNEARAGP